VALGVVRDLRSPRSLDAPGEAAAYQEHLMAAFFASWRGELPAARKWLAAARHYAMARLAAETGLRLAELCGLRLEDLHFGTARSGRSTCGWAKARAGPVPGSGWCRCSGMPGRC